MGYSRENMIYATEQLAARRQRAEKQADENRAHLHSVSAEAVRLDKALSRSGLEAFRVGNKYGNPIEKITFFMAKGSKLPILQYLNDETYEDVYRPIVYVEYSTKM